MSPLGQEWGSTSSEYISLQHGDNKEYKIATGMGAFLAINTPLPNTKQLKGCGQQIWYGGTMVSESSKLSYI